MNTVNFLCSIVRGLLLLAQANIQGPSHVIKEVIQTELYTDQQQKTRDNRGPVGPYQGKYNILLAGYHKVGTDEEWYWTSFEHHVVASDLCYLIDDENSIAEAHNFTESEVTELRQSLIQWYRKNKRDLPWRKQATNPDINQRAYAVWVSEIMLQQTQVVTVIDYYNKWMKKWPTIESLAASSLEEVNEMWSGLGYYSRGRRLFEGAKKVAEELKGEMPRDAESLMKELPGVGKYTAGAIASIAYNQRTGLVDGNVIRVLCRLCMIGADSTSQQVTDVLWSHANTLVDPESPGDFNQAVMELGATVCTPKTPDCSSCPLRNNCKALAQLEHQKQLSAKALKQDTSSTILKDIECLTENCGLCLPETETWDSSLGVLNYPRKGKKKSAREERTAVCLLCRKSRGEEHYFIVQRPEKGLLAGLWEFPSLTLSSDCQEKINYGIVLAKYCLKVQKPAKIVTVGEVVHIFSHIHQTYEVEGVIVDTDDIESVDSTEKINSRWVTRQEFLDAAVSTAMKKVFKAYEAAVSGKTKETKKQAKGTLPEVKNQRAIDMFFKPKTATK